MPSFVYGMLDIYQFAWNVGLVPSCLYFVDVVLFCYIMLTLLFIPWQYNWWWDSLENPWASHIGGAGWSIYWVFRNRIQDAMGEEAWELNCSSHI